MNHVQENETFIHSVLKLLYPQATLAQAIAKMEELNEFDFDAEIGVSTSSNVEGLLHLWEETRLHVVSGQNLLSVGSGSQMQEVEFPPVLRDLLKQTYFRQTQGETVGQILREVPWSVAILVKHRLEEDTSFNSDVSLQVTCITNPDA